MKLPQSTFAWFYQGKNQLLAKGEGLRRGSALSDLLRWEERALPKLGLGSALIRVDAAPVNPSDTLFIQGRYGVQPQAGFVPGFEGCGTVLAANVGPYGWWLKGKRVCFGGQDGNGSWSQYVVVSAFSCIPVSQKLPVEAAATLIVNPMTAIGLIKRAKQHGTKAIVVNAAGASLGQYLIALAKQHNLGFIGLVRREEARERVLQLGADEVLNTTSSDFLAQFKKVCDARQARVLLDAVAGTQTALLMNAMPERSLAIVYGKLAEDPFDGPIQLHAVSADVDGLVFRKQRVEGYWLSHELHGFNGIFTPLWRARRISQLFRSGIFQQPTVASVALEELVPFVDTDTSGKKILFQASAPLRGISKESSYHSSDALLHQT